MQNNAPLFMSSNENIASDGKELLSCRNIIKSYSGIRVLDNVDFNLSSGEVHALIGENGAGKSTLTKIIAGVVSKDSGEMLLDNQAYSPTNLRDAFTCGVAIVHQESALIPSLSVAENMLIGMLPSFCNKIGLLNWNKIYQKTKTILEKVELEINPKALVATLEQGEKRLVELARAISFTPRVLILDCLFCQLRPRQKWSTGMKFCCR